jgi:quinol monooxygenase YgiN
MVQTFLRIKTTPRKTAELVAALRSLSRPARAEKGLISCTSYLLADDANTVCYEERWESREDLEEQIRSPRYKHLLALMESATEQPLLEFRFISETRGLEYVAAVRGEE